MALESSQPRALSICLAASCSAVSCSERELSSDSGEGGAAESTTGHPLQATTHAGETAGSDTPETSSTSSSTTATGEATATDGNTTAHNLDELCPGLRAHYEKCGITDPSPALIEIECEDYVIEADYSRACNEANLAYYECLLVSPCDQLVPQPCPAEGELAFVACSPDTSTGVTSG